MVSSSLQVILWKRCPFCHQELFPNKTATIDKLSKLKYISMLVIFCIHYFIEHQVYVANITDWPEFCWPINCKFTF